MTTSYVTTAARVTAPEPSEESHGSAVRLSWSLVVAGLIFIFGGAAALLALSFAAASTLGPAAEVLSGTCAVGAIFAGAGLLFVSGAQACPTCRERLEKRTLMLPEDAHASLLESIDGGDLALLGFVEGAPLVDAGDKARTGLELESCPACRRSGWVTPVRLRYNESRSSFDAFECGDPTHRSARTMMALARIAESRAASQ